MRRWESFAVIFKNKIWSACLQEVSGLAHTLNSWTWRYTSSQCKHIMPASNNFQGLWFVVIFWIAAPFQLVPYQLPKWMPQRLVAFGGIPSGRMQTNVSLLFFLWFATDFNLIRALCLQYRLSWVLGLLYGATYVAIGNFMMTLEEGLIRPASSNTCQHCTCSWEHHLACLTLTNLTWRIPPNSTKKVTEIAVFQKPTEVKKKACRVCKYTLNNFDNLTLSSLSSKGQLGIRMSKCPVCHLLSEKPLNAASNVIVIQWKKILL